MSEQGEERDDVANLYGGAQWDADALRAEARDLFTTLVEVRDALGEMLEPAPYTGPQVTFEKVSRIRTIVARRTHAGSVDIAEAMREYERGMVAMWGRFVSLTLATWAVDNRASLELLPAAWRDGLYVEAVLAILAAGGMVRPAASEGPTTMPIRFEEAVPAHLRPDVAGAVERFARVQSRVVRRGE